MSSDPRHRTHTVFYTMSFLDIVVSEVLCSGVNGRSIGDRVKGRGNKHTLDGVGKVHIDDNKKRLDAEKVDFWSGWKQRAKKGSHRMYDLEYMGGHVGKCGVRIGWMRLVRE